MKVEQALRIMELALKVINMEGRDFTEKPSVFFLMDGHVARLHIRIYKEGYPQRKRCVRVFAFSLDEPLNAEEYLDYYDYVAPLIMMNHPDWTDEVETDDFDDYEEEDEEDYTEDENS